MSRTRVMTLHRWLKDGLIPGEQVTPGAPRRIRLTDALIARFIETAGDGFVTMQKVTRPLGVTRQTVLHRVKRGEIEAAYVTKGGKKDAMGQAVRVKYHRRCQATDGEPHAPSRRPEPFPHRL
jgi:hypothetical protein